MCETSDTASECTPPDCVLVGFIEHDLVGEASLLLDHALSELNALSLLACPLLMQRDSLHMKSVAALSQSPSFCCQAISVPA